MQQGHRCDIDFLFVITHRTPFVDFGNEQRNNQWVKWWPKGSWLTYHTVPKSLAKHPVVGNVFGDLFVGVRVFLKVVKEVKDKTAANKSAQKKNQDQPFVSIDPQVIYLQEIGETPPKITLLRFRLYESFSKSDPSIPVGHWGSPGYTT